MLRELLHPFQTIYDTHCYQINFDSAVLYHDSDCIALDNFSYPTAGHCWVVSNTLGHSIGVLFSSLVEAVRSYRLDLSTRSF
jgi:hypothetical protein